MANDVRVGLRIQAAIDGLQQVRALVDSLDDLGTEGQQTARQLDALARELEQIAGQQKIVQGFRDQRQALRALDREYAAARTRSSELGRALAQTSQPLQVQIRQFEQARQRTRDLAQAQAEAQRALSASRTALGQAGVNTRNLAAAQGDLARRAADAEQRLQRLQQSAQRLATQRPAPDITRPMREGADRTAAVLGRIPRLLGAIGVTVGLAQVIRGFTEASKSAVTFERALTAITGSAERAAEEQQRLADLAERFGGDVQRIEQAYISWAAAVEGTTLAGRRGNEIFETVVATMGLLGRSTADTEGALLALQQMVSKGAVSMEELRQQLGERLPGAFQAAAAGMGLTTQELSKLVETGELTADELLPKLARQLRRTYSLDDVQRVETLTAAQNRLTNSFTEFFRTLDSATGTTGFIARALDGASVVIRDLSRGTGDAIGNTEGLAGAQREGAQDADGYAIEMDKARDAAGGLGDAAAAAKPPVDELNQSLREQRAIGLQQQLDSLRETLSRAAEQAKATEVAVNSLRIQGVDPAAKAFKDQVALYEASERRLKFLSERYGEIEQALRETLNPALREQAEAQEQAGDAAEKAIGKLGRTAEEVAAVRRLLDQGLISQRTFDVFLNGIDKAGRKLDGLGRKGEDTAKTLAGIYDAINQAERQGEDPATADFRAQLQVLADLRRQQGLLNEARQAGADAVKAERAAAQAGSDAERQAAEAAAEAARQRQKAALEAAGAEAKRSSELAESIDDVRSRANLLRQLAGVLEQVLAGEDAAKAAGGIDQAAEAVERLKQSIEGADGTRLEFDDIGRQLDAIDARTVRPTVDPERRELDEVDRRLQTLQRGVTVPVRIRVSGDTGLLRQLEQANLGLN